MHALHPVQAESVAWVSGTKDLLCGLFTALALLVPVAALALASDFEHPASSDTSQQFTPPPAPTNPQRQDKPNDPGYDRAEPDGNLPHTTNFYDERFDLFGFPSQLTPLALYSDGPNANCGVPPCRQIAGFNAAGAWKRTRGRADVDAGWIVNAMVGAE